MTPETRDALEAVLFTHLISIDRDEVSPPYTTTQDVEREASELADKVIAALRSTEAATLPADDPTRIDFRGERARADLEELELRILRKKVAAVERLPFCPDHRDKVRGKPCRECEIERLTRLLAPTREPEADSPSEGDGEDIPVDPSGRVVHVRRRAARIKALRDQYGEGPEALAVADDLVDLVCCASDEMERLAARLSPPEVSRSGERPEIVCLCGSTRFKDEYIEANRRLTFEGAIVLSVGAFGHADGGLSDEIKLRLDELHLRKIDLADRVLVLNVGGYIGESTRREIAYAWSRGKPVDYLEVPPPVRVPPHTPGWKIGELEPDHG